MGGGGVVRARVESHAGTARLVDDPEATVSVRGLDEILARHPRFASPGLVKIDTDGYDVPIILAHLDLLARLGPVLFFEYDPHFGAEPIVFTRLREIGYDRALVYRNTGELERHVRLDDGAGIEALHAANVGHEGRRYVDACVFRPQHAGVCAAAEAAA